MTKALLKEIERIEQDCKTLEDIKSDIDTLMSQMEI